MSNLNLNSVTSLDTGREVDVNRVMQTVDYVGGLVIDSLDTVIADGDDRYVLAASTVLPYTTTGAGMPEGGAFVSVGDAVLRSDLAAAGGAAIVGSGSLQLPTLAALKSATWPALGQVIRIIGRANLFDGGGNEFEIVAAGTGTADDVHYVDLPAAGLQAKALFPLGKNPMQFGCVGDGLADDTAGLQLFSDSFWDVSTKEQGTAVGVDLKGGLYKLSDTVAFRLPVGSKLFNGSFVADSTVAWDGPTNPWYTYEGVYTKKPLVFIYATESSMSNLYFDCAGVSSGYITSGWASKFSGIQVRRMGGAGSYGALVRGRGTDSKLININQSEYKEDPASYTADELSADGMVYTIGDCILGDTQLYLSKNPLVLHAGPFHGTNVHLWNSGNPTFGQTNALITAGGPYVFTNLYIDNNEIHTYTTNIQLSQVYSLRGGYFADQKPLVFITKVAGASLNRFQMSGLHYDYSAANETLVDFRVEGAGSWDFNTDTMAKYFTSLCKQVDFGETTMLGAGNRSHVLRLFNPASDRSSLTFVNKDDEATFVRNEGGDLELGVGTTGARVKAKLVPDNGGVAVSFPGLYPNGFHAIGLENSAGDKRTAIRQYNTDTVLNLQALLNEEVCMSVTPTSIVAGTGGVSSIGSSGTRFSTAYLVTAPNVSSDERIKSQLKDLTEAEMAVAIELKGAIKTFKLLSDPEGKTHVGVGAQTVIGIFERHGLDPLSYELLSHDYWESELDPDGNEILAGGEQYGVKYEQLLAFVVAAL